MHRVSTLQSIHVMHRASNIMPPFSKAFESYTVPLLSKAFKSYTVPPMLCSYNIQGGDGREHLGVACGDEEERREGGVGEGFPRFSFPHAFPASPLPLFPCEWLLGGCDEEHRYLRNDNAILFCSVKPMYRMDCAAEILDLLNQDEWDNDGFFCGSPPVRANNPVIHDPQFVVQSQSFASSIGNSPSVMQAGRLERGSPTCGSSVGGSPKVRIEGFACSSPGKHHVAPALA
ncbi:hypothetical protein ZIOFF_045424 [Zingiber officinale]|uniref:Uncharacterized protein n=1 Tax=Zingiber officinale TaxID=94328 RepID=A0A8J5FYJ6_ZINOF|nr:hypothetical protein ZIOFF_045424 [Zingiber officinale]